MIHRTIFILGIILGHEISVSGQAGDYCKKLPRKFESPEITVSLAIDTLSTDQPWRVYPDRNNVLVYSDSNMIEVRDTIYFMEEYFVWDETDDAVRLVYRTDSGNIFNGNRFSENVMEIGWVQKNMLILWPRMLISNGVTILAYINKSIPAYEYADGRHSEPVNLSENEVKLYKILKISGSDYLLSLTDQVHNKLTQTDLFWTKSNDVHLLYNRNAFIPDWSKVAEGQSCYCYADLDGALNENHSSAIDSVSVTNSFVGYLNPDTLQESIYQCVNMLDPEDGKIFLNNDHKEFLHAQLLDINQYLLIKEFIEVFFNYLLNKEEFEDQVSDFFRKFGIPDYEINSNTIETLLEKACKIKLPAGKEQKVVRVSAMDDNKKRIYYNTYARLLDILSSEQLLESYRFNAGIAYYWIPEVWFRPDLLSGLSLYTEGGGDHIKRKNYSEFDLIYIDNSADSEEKTYDQLQSEISRLDKTFAQIQKISESNTSTGHLMYYSDAVSPIIDKDYGTLETIVMAMRSGRTSIPSPSLDKLKLENRLLIRELNKVSEKVTIHFIVSDYLYNEEIYERSYLFNEFPQRIQSIAAPQAEVKVVFYVYEKKADYNELMTKLNSFINQIKKEGSSINYEIYKIR
jgi:hypothetical protein